MTPIVQEQAEYPKIDLPTSRVIALLFQGERPNLTELGDAKDKIVKHDADLRLAIMVADGEYQAPKQLWHTLVHARQ